MALRKLGGIDDQDLDAALNALFASATFEDIAAAVDAHPVLSAPAVHALLRSERQANPDDEEFDARYEALFAALHVRLHQRLIEQARTGELAFDDGATTPGFVPATLAAIAAALDGRVPPAGHVPLDPRADGAVLARMAGVPSSLPPYDPPPGTRWVLMSVGCVRCDHVFVVGRPTRVDLLAAPDLAATVRARGINAGACPNCAATLWCPLGLWLADAPLPPDPLEAMSTIWRLAPGVIVYQPPPGTVRQSEADRVLEIRLALMARRHELTLASDAGVIAVAYSPDELAEQFERACEEDIDGAIPFAMEAAVHDLARKLREGLLPIHQAERWVDQLADSAEGWPLVLPGALVENPRDPAEHLIWLLFSAAVARKQQVPTDTLAAIAGLTVHGYLSLGEVGLAEAALARAEDVLAGSPDSTANVVLLEAKADLLIARGELDAAADVRAAFMSGLDLDGVAKLHADTDDVLMRARSGDVAGALRAYPSLLTEWERHVADDDSPGALHHYSGMLANYGAVVTDAAHWMRALQIASDGALDDDQIRDALLALPIDLSQGERMFDPVFDAVTEWMGEVSPRALYTRAHELLTSALELSVQVGGWEFAGIQAGRLIGLSSALDDQAAVERHAHQAIEYAALAGDHLRVRKGHAVLASAALAAGRLDEALMRFDGAALESVRELVGRGYAHGDPELELVEGLALSLLHAEADAAHVAATLESVRAARTANAVLVGMPRGEAASPELRRQRERLRSSGEDPAKLRAIEAELQALERAQGVRDERFGNWVDATSVALATAGDLRAHLGQTSERSAWITVVTSGDRFCSIAVSAGEATVGGWWEPLPNPPRWTRTALARVASAILDPHPALRVLRPGDQLVISLPEALSGVPVGALPFDDRPLCAHADVVCVHGLGLFAAAGRVPALATSSVLLLGAPERDDLAPLPGARREVELIADALAAAGVHVDLRVDAAASATALLDTAAEHDIVHVSCHATADPVALMLSGDAAAEDSGWLTEDRVLSELRLKPGCLVNLAGCRTGHAEQSSGPVLGGLVPKMLVAGARAAVASLWPIRDEATVALQQAFYRHLIAGRSPAGALADAQTEAWSGRLGAELADPQVWAAFVVYGAG